MKEDWTKHKEEIIEIIKLIEDKDLPARRNITDYIEQMFGYPSEMSSFITSEYEKYDNQHLITNPNNQERWKKN